MFITLLALVSSAFATSDLSMDFLDVGQGDGVLIQTADGQTILIDGGKASAHVEDQLKALGISHIDLLVATHAHDDHIGGHEAILTDFVVDEYVTNGLSYTSKTFGRILALAEGQEAAGTLDLVSASSLVAGDDLGAGDLHIYMLPAPASITGTDQNTHSVGMVVEYQGFKALITGDSEKAETAAWLADAASVAFLDDVDVYKSIHHGSSNGDADNISWLDHVMPENVVVQVGANSYGHPTASSLDTYEVYAAEVWRNDEDGKVSIDVYSTGGYTIATETDGAVMWVSSDPVLPESVSTCPSTHPVKGNIGTERIYHLSTGSYYSRTQPEECFGTAADAVAAGYRASSR